MEYSGKIENSRSKHKTSKCPSCKGESTLRTSRPRNTKERILKTIPWLHMFRCKKCGWRGWKMNLSIDVKMVKKTLVIFLLVVIAAFVVYNLLKLIV